MTASFATFPELLERPKYSLEEFASIIGAAVYVVGGSVTIPPTAPTEYEVSVAVLAGGNTVITATVKETEGEGE